MATSPFQVKAHNMEWRKSTTVFGKGLLPWQQDAFKAVKGARFSLIVAFMGSGKSYVQLTLGADEIISSKCTQKQLVIVPQSHIHEGFVKETLHLGSKEVQWEILHEHKFIGDKNTDVVEGLKAWLLEPGDALFQRAGATRKNLKGITAVTSHSALALTWKKLSPTQKKRAIHNLTLRVDEAHHIKNIMAIKEPTLNAEEIRESEGEANNLGAICSYILKSTDETAHLAITTATPFRGDQDDILKPAARKMFKTYYLPFFDHWKSLGIENFGLDYLMYKGSPVQMCVKRILDEPNERHMIVIPATTRKWRKVGHEHQSLLAKLEKRFPGQVLDLVDPSASVRKSNKARLRREPRKPSDSPSTIRVIVTCMVGREGTDWCPCSRLHNLSQEASVTLAVQTLGRPFRRFFPDKREVFVFNYVEEFESPEEGGTVKEALSHRTNALLTCMIFDEEFHPILLPKLPGQAASSGPYFSGWLAENGYDYEALKVALVALDASPDFPVEERNGETVKAAMITVMDELEVAEEDRKRFYDGANRMLAGFWKLGHQRQAKDMAIKGMDVGFLYDQGYDKLVEFVDAKDRSIVFTGTFAERDLMELKGMFSESFEARVDRILKELI